MVAISIILGCIIVLMIIWFNFYYKPRVIKEIKEKVEPYIVAAIDPEIYLSSLILDIQYTNEGNDKQTIVDFSVFEEKGIIYMIEKIPKRSAADINYGPIFIKNAIVYNTPRGWLCKF